MFSYFLRCFCHLYMLPINPPSPHSGSSCKTTFVAGLTWKKCFRWIRKCGHAPSSHLSVWQVMMGPVTRSSIFMPLAFTKKYFPSSQTYCEQWTIFKGLYPQKRIKINSIIWTVYTFHHFAIFKGDLKYKLAMFFKTWMYLYHILKVE